MLVLCIRQVAFAQHQKVKSSTLENLVAVIDPGHGGSDPGAHGEANGVNVYEKVYVYDVALRLQRILKKRGAHSFMTVVGKSKINNLPASKIVQDNGNETFTIDGTVVKAGSRGLHKRLAYGNSIAKKNPNKRQVWISIHFDVVGMSKDINGVRVIEASSSKTLGKALITSFGKVGRLRENAPLVVSGDQSHGIRKLYVLRDTNHIREKVLIELGNFRNKDDLWRIRDPKVREKYAESIANALSVR